jgi:hypothetical protein
MPHPTPSPRTPATLLLLAASMTAFSAAAAPAESNDYAKANPYYIGARQAFTHNSNVYAIQGGPGDTYSSTGIFGGFDQPLGRGRLYASGSVDVNRFQDQTALNNVSYSLAAGLDWATINRISGTFYATASQSLASLGANGTIVPVGVRNLLKTDEVGARVRWGGASLLTVEGGVAHNRVSYSAEQAASGDASQDSGSIALYYRPSGLLRLGTALRFVHGEQPTVPVVDGGTLSNTYNTRYLDLLADWTPSARTSVGGRLSWTRQSNSNNTGLDFSGLTGAVNAAWQATGKIGLNASLSRDAGINSGAFSTTLIPTNDLFPPIVINGLSENSQITDTLSLGATYAATEKINAFANVGYQHAKWSTKLTSGDVTIPGSDTTDNLRQFALGVNYTPARNWLLGCNIGRFSRSSGFTSFSYTANTVGCMAQYTYGR